MSELITQTHDPAESAPNVSGDEAAPSAPRLSLTDFLDTASLQEIQDAFTSVTRLATTIRDADGNAVTAPTDARARAESDLAIDQLLGGDADAEGDQKLVAPIIVEGQALGSIEVERQIDALGRMSDQDLASLRKMGASWGLSEQQIEQLLTAAEDLFASKRGAAIQFLYLLANAIARLCYDAYHARQRVEELSALYQVSNLIAGQRDLQQVLDTAARAIAQVMKVKGVVIRMLEDSPEGRSACSRTRPKAAGSAAAPATACPTNTSTPAGCWSTARRCSPTWCTTARSSRSKT